MSEKNTPQDGKLGPDPSRYRFHNYENRKVINLPGVRLPYPKSWVELCALGLVLALIALLLVRVTDKDFLASASGRVFSIFEIAPDGSVQNIPGRTRYGFWTPGENTVKKSVIPPPQVPTANATVSGNEPQAATKEPGVSAAQPSPIATSSPGSEPPLEDWEANVTDEQLVEFGKKLKTVLGATGYRRHEVVGQGRVKFKRGWWWVVTVPSSVKPGQVGALYRDFFKPKKEIYLESMGEAP